MNELFEDWKQRDHFGVEIADWLIERRGFKTTNRPATLLRIDDDQQSGIFVIIGPTYRFVDRIDGRLHISFGIARRDINELFRELKPHTTVLPWSITIVENNQERFFDDGPRKFGRGVRRLPRNDELEALAVIDGWIPRLAVLGKSLQFIESWLEEHESHFQYRLINYALDGRWETHGIALARTCEERIIATLPPDPHPASLNILAFLQNLDSWANRNPNGKRSVAPKPQQSHQPLARKALDNKGVEACSSSGSSSSSN